jgi:hypothetical protein
MADTERYTAAKNALQAHNGTCAFCSEEGFVNYPICPTRQTLSQEVFAAAEAQDEAQKTNTPIAADSN